MANVTLDRSLGTTCILLDGTITTVILYFLFHLHSLFRPFFWVALQTQHLRREMELQTSLEGLGLHRRIVLQTPPVLNQEQRKLTHMVRQALDTLPLPAGLLDWLNNAVTTIQVKMPKLGQVYHKGPGFHGPNATVRALMKAQQAGIIETIPVRCGNDTIAVRIRKLLDAALQYVKGNVLGAVMAKTCMCGTWMRDPVLRNSWGHVVCRSPQQWQAVLGELHGKVLSAHARTALLPTHDARDAQVEQLCAKLTALSMPGDGDQGLLCPQSVTRYSQELRYGGGKNLVWEETCLEKFRTANSGAIFPITFHDCGGIFPILFFGHQVQNLYPVLGGGMIGGGGCRIRYVTWMDGQGSILQGTSGCLPHVVAS